MFGNECFWMYGKIGILISVFQKLAKTASQIASMTKVVLPCILFCPRMFVTIINMLKAKSFFNVLNSCLYTAYIDHEIVF